MSKTQSPPTKSNKDTLQTPEGLRNLESIDQSIEQTSKLIQEQENLWESDVVELKTPINPTAVTRREEMSLRERRATMTWVIILALLLMMLLVKKTRRAHPSKQSFAPTLTSPMTSQVTAVFVEPGEEVRSGQLILTLDSNQLELNRIELIKRSDDLNAAYESSLAKGKTRESRRLSENIRELDEDLELILSQMEMTLVCADRRFVVSKDFVPSNLIGQRVRTGESLVEMQPFQQH